MMTSLHGEAVDHCPPFFSLKGAVEPRKNAKIAEKEGPRKVEVRTH